MLDSVLRVTRSQESGWSIETEPAHERYLSGIQDTQKGKRVGFAKMIYTRVSILTIAVILRTRAPLIPCLRDIDSSTLIAVERSKMTNWVSRG
jgi:hypothetical protein